MESPPKHDALGDNRKVFPRGIDCKTSVVNREDLRFPHFHPTYNDDDLFKLRSFLFINILDETENILA